MLSLGRKALDGSEEEHESIIVERVNLIMKIRKMGRFGKAAVAGFAALMMLAESVTAFACPAEPQFPEGVCTCGEEGHEGCEGCGEVILYDEQFVDEEGNIYPSHTISMRLPCFKHEKVEGYLQNHYKYDDGSCTVKTYKATTCLICDTIWMGDLVSARKYVTCPH